MAGKRANGEGSIFHYKGKWAGYVWVTTPGGEYKRAWCYGETRKIVHDKWLKLHAAAKRGPVITKAPMLGEYALRARTHVGPRQGSVAARRASSTAASRSHPIGRSVKPGRR